MIQFKYLLGLLFIGMMATTFVACEKDKDNEPRPGTIAEVAASDPQFSILVGALERVGLVSVLNSDGPFTVFAPTNDAFNDLGVDLNAISDDALTEILLYHVLGAQIMAGDIQEGQTYASTAAQTGPNNSALSILIEKVGTAVKINGAVNVTATDVEASNGVIHVVDAVILPLDVVGHAVANANFTELVGALGAASGDLVSVLQGDGPFTVFAPLNSAFDAIADVVSTLNADQLASVLTYHVVGGNIRSTDLADGIDVTTVEGQTFRVNLGNTVTLTDAQGGEVTVILTDVQGTNGVIHVIDAVLLPNL